MQEPSYTSMAVASMEDSAFWVALTFAVFLVYLFLQGYWTRWAHRRVDSLSRRVDDIKKDIDDMRDDLEEIRTKNPMTWMRRMKG